MISRQVCHEYIPLTGRTKKKGATKKFIKSQGKKEANAFIFKLKRTIQKTWLILI